MALSSRLTTAEELLALDDDHRRHELVAGFVVSEPPASFRHGAVAAEVFARLIEFVKQEDLGRVVSTETGFLLGRNPDTVRAPDISFVSRSRVERAGTFRGFFPGPPDLAVEILSPSERPADVHAKIGDYLAAGTRIVWVIDPSRRQVRVYRSLLQPIALDETKLLEGDEVLPGFSVRVARLFPA
jgi:Uma2 family endonuclease